MAIKYDNCKDCHSRCVHAGKDREFICINGVSCKITKENPKTNADRIRAMTDEELARKLVNTSYRYDWKQDEDYWYFPNGTTKTNYKPKATEAWLEWLKHPAEQKKL